MEEFVKEMNHEIYNSIMHINKIKHIHNNVVTVYEDDDSVFNRTYINNFVDNLIEKGFVVKGSYTLDTETFCIISKNSPYIAPKNFGEKHFYFESKRVPRKFKKKWKHILCGERYNHISLNQKLWYILYLSNPNYHNFLIKTICEQQKLLHQAK